MAATTLALTAVTAINFNPIEAITAQEYSFEYTESFAVPGDILVADTDGYLVKINPQTDTANRIGMTDFAVHTVESGETLSVIAARYGVSTSTIMWENQISNANSIRTGQKLLVPPVDGVSYNVGKSDTVDSIAKKFDIGKDAILAQNNLDTDSLVKGQKLFLPGAEPLAPPAPPVNVAAVTNGSNVRASRAVDYSQVSGGNDSPVIGKPFVFPTRGGITQGFSSAHYALDIADRSKPPIWAAAGGTVVKVSTGTWGGGYGNHVIIDHGGGLQTLYAHMDSVNVSVGQWVNQNDVIGIMGNTGRVYGVTGIHLHWEVIDNGVKRNPRSYY